MTIKQAVTARPDGEINVPTPVHRYRQRRVPGLQKEN